MSLDPDRLSQIDTMWSMVRLAHDKGKDDGKSAQEAILDRYGGAARRYLLGSLRDNEAADEVFQEFALRFIRGDFRSADPERGRFRQFLKTILFRMVMDFYRERKRSPNACAMDSAYEPGVDGDEVERDRQFASSWREDLLARTWLALGREEATTGKPVYTTLKTRAECPELHSPELAVEVGRKLGKEISAANLRVMLHRARELFADLLIEEVIHSLDQPDPEKVESELIELRLMEYCRPALQRYQEKSKKNDAGL
jgi:DNA-directed RNA polymerase specialized sigma24 family protein